MKISCDKVKDLVYPHEVRELLRKMIRSQEACLSDLCYDMSKIDTKYIIQANKLLQQKWGDKYDEIFQDAYDRRKLRFDWFKREWVQFTVNTLIYAACKKDYSLLQDILLFFTYTMYSRHLKYYIKYCNPEVMAAAFERSKYLSHLDLCKKILQTQMKYFEKIDDKHVRLIFDVLVRINNLTKSFVKRLAKYYYKAAEELKQTGSLMKSDKDLIDYNALITLIRQHWYSIVDLQPYLEKRIRVRLSSKEIECVLTRIAEMEEEFINLLSRTLPKAITSIDDLKNADVCYVKLKGWLVFGKNPESEYLNELVDRIIQDCGITKSYAPTDVRYIILVVFTYLIMLAAKHQGLIK